MLLTWVNTLCAILLRGHAVARLVEALRYKPQGREFDSGFFHWHNHSAALWPWGRLGL
jgi:hypothetical protein